MLQINPNLSDLIIDAHLQLEDHYGPASKACITATAPGRINLIGEHIDYCDGLVLPMAIDRHVVISARIHEGDEACIASADNDEPAIIRIDKAIERGDPTWSYHLRGVLHGFQQRGHQLPGFEAYIISSIPSGGGLSSSAALQCAFATLLEGLLDTTLPTREKALLCQKAEQDFVGVPCGIMDHYSSAFGQKNRLVFIDCQSGTLELIPFNHPELTLLIADSMVYHNHAQDAYSERRRETERGLTTLGKSSWRDVTSQELESKWHALGAPVNRRARHVVTEMERASAAAEALSDQDYEALGPLMSASHDSLRDDFEVSCNELDKLVEIARDIGREGGVIGTRMTGGGFGGCTVTLCESAKVPSIADILASEYEAASGIRPQIFASRPCDGARLV